MSAWPIFLVVNELPKKIRYKRENILLFVVWTGSKKPDIQNFLRVMVEKFSDYHITIQGTQFRVLVLAGVFDLPCKACICNMVQYNGAFPCLYCIMLSDRGNARYFPLESDPSPPRTVQSITENAQRSLNSTDDQMCLGSKDHVWWLSCPTLTSHAM